MQTEFDSLVATMPPETIQIDPGMKAVIVPEELEVKVNLAKEPQEEKKNADLSEAELKEKMFTSPETFYWGGGAEYFRAPDKKETQDLNYLERLVEIDKNKEDLYFYGSTKCEEPRVRIEGNSVFCGGLAIHTESPEELADAVKRIKKMAGK